MAERRPVQVFVWKEGDAASPDYIQQVLHAAAPEAAAVPGGVPLQSAAVWEGWPADIWSYALPRMRQGQDWTDPARYELAGWVGRDSRTGARLFVASVFARAAPPGPGPAPLGYGTPPAGFPVGYPPAGAPGLVAGGYPAPGYVPAPVAPPPEAYPNQTGITADELGATYGTYYVGLGPRLVAGLVDLVLLSMLELLIVLSAVLLGRWIDRTLPDPGAFPAVLACGAVGLGVLVLLSYLADFWAWRGQTPGLMMMGLKVVTVDGSKPRLGRAFLRALGYLMSILTFGIGFLLIASDEHKQGLHDRIANTFVVPVQPPADPRPADLPGYPPAAPPPGAEAPVPAPPTPAPLAPAAPPPVPSSMIAGSFPAGAPPAPSRPAPPPAAPPVVPAPAAAEWPADAGAAPFQRGLALLVEGVREPGGDRTLLIVEPEAGQAATAALRAAAAAVPAAGLYRYFVGVARRYGEGYAEAAPEFEHARRLDPSYWEAQMQSFFGPLWHDAFAYPAWSAQETTLSGVLRTLLPARPGSRLVLVREGGTRTVAVLSTTRRSSWHQLPTLAMPARLQLVASPTPAGLVVAVYVAIRDNPANPYRGETFINPAEAAGPAGDATQLGQNLVLQLARQRHTYLIFADESGSLLHNRRLLFDAATGQNLAAVAAMVQAAAYQAIARNQSMALAQFQAAAAWHMQQFPLEQVRV